MSEMSFEQMLDASLKSIHAGEIVTGKVISVKPDEIALNIGYKSDGIMTRSDYSADNTVDLTTVVNVGDEIESQKTARNIVNVAPILDLFARIEIGKTLAARAFRKAFVDKPRRKDSTSGIARAEGAFHVAD